MKDGRNVIYGKSSSVRFRWNSQSVGSVYHSLPSDHYGKVWDYWNYRRTNYEFDWWANGGWQKAAVPQGHYGLILRIS